MRPWDGHQAGDSTHQMYLLLEGELQLEDPKGHLLTMLGPGGFFGAATFVYGGKQSATVGSIFSLPFCDWCSR